MKTAKQIVGLIIGLLISINTEAQNGDLSVNSSSYKTAIGLRAGGTSGLTVKHFMGESSALEGIFGVWPHGFSVTGLYEKHANAGAEGLLWYYGGGAHVAIQSSNRLYRSYYDRRYDYYYRTGGNLGLGIDGIIGLEYKIKPIPFAISLDAKPFVEVNTRGGAYVGLDPSIGIKVTF